jgi:hypothetical protein
MDTDPLTLLVTENRRLRAQMATLIEEREALRAQIRELTGAGTGLSLDELAETVLRGIKLAEEAMADPTGRRRYVFSDVQVELQGSVQKVDDRLTVRPAQAEQPLSPENLSRVALRLSPIPAAPAPAPAPAPPPPPPTVPDRAVWERAQALHGAWRFDLGADVALELAALFGIVLDDPSVLTAATGGDWLRQVADLQARLAQALAERGGLPSERIEPYVQAVKDAYSLAESLTGRALSPDDLAKVVAAQQAINVAVERLTESTG